MYIPKAFEEPDRNAMLDFIRSQPFASLITSGVGNLQVSHVPLYHMAIDGRDHLVGHLAMANEHWKSLEGSGLAVFGGPHAYVSYKWYQARNVVPTWNYVAVHASGPISTVGPGELERILDMTVEVHEGDAEGLRENMDAEVFRNLARHIVGFKLEIGKLEGKWKLSQNKPPAAQARIAEALSQSEDWNARQVSTLMIRNLARPHKAVPE